MIIIIIIITEQTQQRETRERKRGVSLSLSPRKLTHSLERRRNEWEDSMEKKNTESSS
jgi:hypothetical protein